MIITSRKFFLIACNYLHPKKNVPQHGGTFTGVFHPIKMEITYAG